MDNNNGINKAYIPYGEEWVKEMMKFPKPLLITKLKIEYEKNAALQPSTLPLIDILNVKTAEDWYMKRLEKLQALIETAFIEGYKRRNSNNYSSDWKEFVKQHEETLTF